MNNFLKTILTLFIFQLSFSQVIEVTHQGNGTTIQMPIESIDSVNIINQNGNFLKTIHQNNGNILGLAVQDVDSITYVIPEIDFLPSISTMDISNIGSTLLYSGGYISSDGGSPVLQRGVCWNTSPNPTIANNHTFDGSGLGQFNSEVNPLTPSTVYFVRAYATNENGTNYGNELIVTTLDSDQSAQLLSVSTDDIIYNDGVSAQLYGSLESPFPANTLGFCWSVGITPTINSNNIIVENSQGSFNAIITDLSPDTIYRVRAFASNDAGISYGEEVLFRTNDLASGFSISGYNYLSNNTVALLMSVAYDGESEITEKGVCWKIADGFAPTFEDNVVSLGSGEGSFNKTFTNLDSETAYSFRPYAINGMGISYGYGFTYFPENSITLEDIYYFLYDDFGITGSRHYDFGQKGVDIFSDLLSGDMALSQSAYGWYNSTSNLEDTVQPNMAVTDFIYRYYFRIIDSTNLIIESFTPFGSIPDADEDRWKLGQAMALRGYAYFYLSQLFQEDFDLNQEILPLHVDGQFNDIPVQMGDIYSLIEYDLQTANQLLNNFVRVNKLHIDKTVVQGLLAYTHAAMGNYAEAREWADSVISSSYPISSVDELVFPGENSGFNNINSPSWIWGVDITEDMNQNLINWWGQMDLFTYSYAWAGDHKSIDNVLYTQINLNDVRRNQFVNIPGHNGLLMPANKFFDPNREIGGQFLVSTDYIFMRSDEFYLLSAECDAKLGNDDSARLKMSSYLSSRSPDDAIAVGTLGGASLIDFISFQSRIELWGEGKSYLLMKRNNNDVIRGTNHVFRAAETFAHDSDELTYDMDLSDESTYEPPQLDFLNCDGLEIEGSMFLNQQVNDFIFTIPYVTNVGAYINGNANYQSMSIPSNGVLGLTANLEIGTFNEFEGDLEFTVTGTPQNIGTAVFVINIDNKICEIQLEVLAAENCSNGFPTVLTINFDDAPEETYWELYSASDGSTPLYSGGQNGAYSGMSSVNIPFCLEDGDYVLSFFDSGFNGIEMGGSYQLYDTFGNEYACGGYFENSNITYFTTGENTDFNELNLEITLDSWPEEVFWWILDQDGTTVYSPGEYSPYANPYTGLSGTVSLYICDLPSGTYTFEIYDDYGDGAGPVNLLINGVQVFYSDGTYGGFASATFTIP